MRNAFAPIVRARPCPIFGRPVRLRGRPHRLQPDTSPHALRIPDRSGHPALRDIPSSWLQVRLGRVRLSPSCPFKLLHTRLLSRPARHYPRFRIRRSSSERRGDFNPPDSRAAQRTVWSGPTPIRDAASCGCPSLAAPTGDRRWTLMGLIGSGMGLLAVTWSKPPAEHPVSRVTRQDVQLSLVRAPALPPQHADFGSQFHTPSNRCLRFGPRVAATPARLAPVPPARL